MESLHTAFQGLIDIAIFLMEFLSVIVIVIAASKAFVGLFKRSPHIQLELAEGVALALEFKLGSEVLRTLVVRTLDELLMLGAVVLICAAISVHIRWGIRWEESRMDPDNPRPKKQARRKGFKKAIPEQPQVLEDNPVQP